MIFFPRLLGEDYEAVSKYLMPAFVVSSLVLPIILADLLFFSNKFAGPILTIRRKMAELANQETGEEICLRPGDHLQDMCDNYNKIRARLVATNEQTASTTLQDVADNTTDNSPVGIGS